MKIWIFILFCLLCFCAIFLLLLVTYLKATQRMKKSVTFNRARISLIKLDKAISDYASSHDMNAFPAIQEYLSHISILIEDSTCNFKSTILKPVSVRESLLSPLGREILHAPDELSDLLVQYSKVLHTVAQTKNPIKSYLWDAKKNSELQILKVIIKILLFMLKRGKGKNVFPRKAEEAKQLEVIAQYPNLSAPNLYVTT